LNNRTYSFLFQKETKSHSPPTQDQNYNEDRQAETGPERNLLYVAAQPVATVLESLMKLWIIGIIWRSAFSPRSRTQLLSDAMARIIDLPQINVKRNF
jgi:hypothetical protein